MKIPIVVGSKDADTHFQAALATICIDKGKSSEEFIGQAEGIDLFQIDHGGQKKFPTRGFVFQRLQSPTPGEATLVKGITQFFGIAQYDTEIVVFHQDLALAVAIGIGKEHFHRSNPHSKRRNCASIALPYIGVQQGELA